MKVKGDTSVHGVYFYLKYTSEFIHWVIHFPWINDPGTPSFVRTRQCTKQPVAGLSFSKKLNLIVMQSLGI